MGGGSEVLLEVWRAPLDLFSKSFEYKKKIELVQISIQMQIYAVGGRDDALPSAPGESVFKTRLKKEISFIKKGGHYKGEANRP
jgi:hypothetical protein